MNRFLKAAAACSAVFFIFSSVSGAAWDFSFLRTRTPAHKIGANGPEDAKGAAADAIKREYKAAGIGYTEFDGFNNIEDPLYREGSKEFLQKAVEAEKAKKAVSKDFPARPVIMRDAPISLPAKKAQPVRDRNIEGQKAPAPPLKKNRLIKMIPADPLKAKSTL